MPLAPPVMTATRSASTGMTPTLRRAAGPPSTGRGEGGRVREPQATVTAPSGELAGAGPALGGSARVRSTAPSEPRALVAARPTNRRDQAGGRFSWPAEQAFQNALYVGYSTPGTSQPAVTS